MSPIKGLQLVTHDLRSTRAELVERGAELGEIPVFEGGGPRDARDGAPAAPFHRTLHVVPV